MTYNSNLHSLHHRNLVALSLLLLLASRGTAAAQQQAAPGVAETLQAATTNETQAANADGSGEILLASFYRRTMQSAEQSERGEEFPKRPYWGTNIEVVDPMEFEHPRSTDCDDPSSFFYTYRPNIFNIPVEAEWDFYNLINTDRPDFTDAVYTVGKGVTYLETGYTFRKTTDPLTAFSTRQLPESLIRYGLTKNFELRMKWAGYLMTDAQDRTTGATVSQFGGEDLDLAFKWAYLQQRGWRPMLTVAAGSFVPTGTNGMSANTVQPHFNLLAGWGLRRWAYLKTQFGCDFLRTNSTRVVLTDFGLPTLITQRSHVDSWHQSISLLTQWTKRVGAYHEWFMISNVGGGDNRAQNYLDAGLFLYATTNVQFDVRLGFRLSDRVNDVFTGAGFSTRW
jgi:hypothetical protein